MFPVTLLLFTSSSFKVAVTSSMALLLETSIPKILPISFAWYFPLRFLNFFCFVKRSGSYFNLVVYLIANLLQEI